MCWQCSSCPEPFYNSSATAVTCTSTLASCVVRLNFIDFNTHLNNKLIFFIAEKYSSYTR